MQLSPGLGSSSDLSPPPTFPLGVETRYVTGFSCKIDYRLWILCAYAHPFIAVDGAAKMARLSRARSGLSTPGLFRKLTNLSSRLASPVASTRKRPQRRACNKRDSSRRPTSMCANCSRRASTSTRTGCMRRSNDPWYANFCFWKMYRVRRTLGRQTAPISARAMAEEEGRVGATPSGIHCP